MSRKTPVRLLALVCALAVSAVAAPSALADDCYATLEDTSGMPWQIDGDYGYVDEGESDAYDSMGYAYFGENRTNDTTSYYSGSDADSNSCTYEEDGRELVFPVDEDVDGLGVDVHRKVYVPSSGEPFARWLDIIVNPSDTETKTITYEWYGEYGEIYGGVVADENENGIVDIGENWAAFNQDDPGDTNFASLWDGPDGDSWDRPYDDDETYVPGDDEEDYVDYMYDDVVIPPGGTAVMMHIEHQNPSSQAAAQWARDNGDGNEEFFAGMSDEELDGLRNWNPDADDDGVPTHEDNCAQTANPDQADLDQDGLGDACDDDIDGDGFSNEQEERLGTNPASADSDGDGVFDGLDQCPTRAGNENGCPPIASGATATPPAAVVLPRLTPNRLTLNVRKTRPGRRLRLRSSGRVLLPAGVTAAEGCRSGVAIVTVKSGGNTVSTRLADVQPDCTYRSTVTFSLLNRLGNRRLVVRAHFTGNDRLTRRKSSRVRAGRA